MKPEKDWTDARESGAVTAQDLAQLKAEARDTATYAARVAYGRRSQAEETRFAIWEGQSDDGRKHAETNGGRPAFPFEGASDARIRLADMIVNERVLILTAAALRNMPRVKGLDLSREHLGHKLTTVLKWVLKNKLGSGYFRTIAKLAQYQEGDAPAGAMLGVWWNQESALELTGLTIEDVRQQLMQSAGPEAAQTLNQMDVALQNPARDKETAQILMGLDPRLTEARALRAIAELRQSGACKYPVEVLVKDGPELCAYRVYDGIFFPVNTTDAQRCRCYFVREWLSRVELLERQVSMDYSAAFVEATLQHEGRSGWAEAEPGRASGASPLEGGYSTSGEEHRGEYEVVTAFYKAVNADHIPGIYYVAFSFHHEEPAHERKLLEYSHGQYPFTWFSREVLSERLLDARGVPELVSTDQQALKLLADSFNDNVSLATVPPLKVPRRRGKLGLVIGPLKLIKEDRPGDITWMQPPQYPMGNDKQQEEIRRRVDEYFGRISQNVPPMLTQLHQAGMVMFFLANLADALTQLLQLCQQYMSQEELALITGDDGIPVARSIEEIQGKFSVELTFDPRDLDMEYLKQITELLINVILRADTLNVVQRDKLIQRLFMAIDPNLAQATVRPVADAQASEVEAEQGNFAKISAGVEPEMVAEGQNFPLRLQVLEQIAQKNPEAIQKLSPVSAKIFEARVKYLQNQVQQIRNAQIGRTVGQPALGQQ